MFYDQHDGPSREQLHAELDRLLDQGRAEREDDGWPTLPSDLTSDLQNFFVAIGDATAQRDIDKNSPLKITVSDRTETRFPGAWVSAPHTVTDLASAVRTMDAARALNGVAFELQRDASFYFDHPALFGKTLIESDLVPEEGEKTPNATTRAAMLEAEMMKSERRNRG